MPISLTPSCMVLTSTMLAPGTNFNGADLTNAYLWGTDFRDAFFQRRTLRAQT